IGPSVWAPAAAWCAVALSVALLPRPLTAALAWVAALLDLAVQGVEFQRFAGPSVFDSWLPVLGLLAAGALTLGTGTGPALRILGPRRLLLLACLVVGMLGLESWRWTVSYPYQLSTVDTFLPALGVLVLVGLDRPVRRRVLALFAPVGV